MSGRKGGFCLSFFAREEKNLFWKVGNFFLYIREEA